MTSQSYSLLLLCVVASMFVPLTTGTQCVDSLPDFRNTGHLQREGLSNGIAAVIPAYNFSCTGHVKQWRAHVERRRNRYDRYELTFSVWRKTSLSDDCEYQLVGENSAQRGLAPELGDNDTALGTVTLNVSTEEQILVLPGDFVGFKVEHYEVEWPSGERIGAGAASVMVDLEQTEVLVWYKQLPFDQTCLRERDIDGTTEHYSGVFEPTPLPAAPVIAVQVESVTSLPTTTTMQDPTSSPATSPSPSPASSHSLTPLTSQSLTPVSSASSAPPTPGGPTVAQVMPLSTIIVLVLVLCVVLMAAILVMLAIIFCVRRRLKNRSKRNITSPTDSEMFENRVYFHNKSLLTASNKLSAMPDNKSPSCRGFSNAMYDAPVSSSNSRSASHSTETITSCKETSFYHKPNPSSAKTPAQPNDYLRVYNALSPSPPLVRPHSPPSTTPPLYDTIPASSHVYDIPSIKKAGSIKRDLSTGSLKYLDVKHSPVPPKREGSTVYDMVPVEDVQDGDEGEGVGEMVSEEGAERVGMGGYEYMASAVDLASPSSASQSTAPLYDSIKLSS